MKKSDKGLLIQLFWGEEYSNDIEEYNDKVYECLNIQDNYTEDDFIPEWTKIKLLKSGEVVLECFWWLWSKSEESAVLYPDYNFRIYVKCTNGVLNYRLKLPDYSLQRKQSIEKRTKLLIKSLQELL